MCRLLEDRNRPRLSGQRSLPGIKRIPCRSRPCECARAGARTSRATCAHFYNSPVACARPSPARARGHACARRRRHMHRRLATWRFMLGRPVLRRIAFRVSIRLRQVWRQGIRIEVRHRRLRPMQRCHGVKLHGRSSLRHTVDRRQRRADAAAHAVQSASGSLARDAKTARRPPVERRTRYGAPTLRASACAIVRWCLSTGSVASANARKSGSRPARASSSNSRIALRCASGPTAAT